MLNRKENTFEIRTQQAISETSAAAKLYNLYNPIAKEDSNGRGQQLTGDTFLSGLTGKEARSGKSDRTFSFRIFKDFENWDPFVSVKKRNFFVPRDFFFGCRKKPKLFRSRNERPNPQNEQFSERFGSGGRRALGEVRRRWSGDKKLCRVVQLAAAGTEEVRNSLQVHKGISCGKETEKCQEGAS